MDEKLNLPAEFYCIKIIKPDGTRGWVIDRPDGISFVMGGANTDITMFETESAANKFIRERKIERQGVKAYVRTNQEMIQDAKKVETPGISPATSLSNATYHLENHKGEKCYYDSKEEVYFFKDVNAGFPCWFDEPSIRRFVKDMKFEQALIFAIKHENGKTEKKLIQTYGCRKNEDGTFADPEYIEVEEGTDYKIGDE